MCFCIQLWLIVASRNGFVKQRFKMSGWNNLFFVVAEVSLVIDVDAFGKGPDSDAY